MSHQPILCVDFDGVVHRYSRGWQDGALYDDVVPGWFAWARHAATMFDLVIYSSRSKTSAGIEAMKTWMAEQAKKAECLKSSQERGDFLNSLKYASQKPPAFLTIDDRCVRFDGDWTAPEMQPDALRAFKPWNQKPALVNDNPSTETECDDASRACSRLRAYALGQLARGAFGVDYEALVALAEEPDLQAWSPWQTMPAQDGQWFLWRDPERPDRLDADQAEPDESGFIVMKHGCGLQFYPECQPLRMTDEVRDAVARAEHVWREREAQRRTA